MNKRVDVSIIMTVYNTEQYVEKAIKSVLNSDMTNYELIIVNDCSTDNSLNILKKMQRKYKNIILIENSQNMGAGLLKNEGLKIARGKYIGFIDSDDYVDRNYFLNMFNLAGKEQSDIVVSDIVVINNGQGKYNNIYENNVYSNRYVNNTTVLSKEVILGNWACASSCSKLFKSDILNGLSFSSKNSDDIMLSIPAIYKSNKISYCEGNKYYYVQRENSIVNKQGAKTKQVFTVLDNVIEYYKKMNLYNEYEPQIEYTYSRLLLCSSLKRMIQIPDKLTRKLLLEETWQNLNTKFPNWKKNELLKKNNTVNGLFMKTMNNITFKIYTKVLRLFWR